MVCFCHLFIGAMLPGGGNPFVKHQKHTARFVHLSLLVCFFVFIVGFKNTKLNQDRIPAVKTVVGIYIMGFKKGNANAHRQTPTKVKVQTQRKKAYVLWEVNNSYGACDHRRAKTFPLQSSISDLYCSQLQNAVILL